MSEKILNTRLQLRNDTAAKWIEANPVLKKGEMGIEIDTNKYKFGDGVTEWSLLPYASNIPSSAVFFEEDITLAGSYTAVGNIEKKNGKFEAKGKTVEDLFTEIFTKELDPGKSNPAFTKFELTCGTSFEAGTTVTPTWTSSFSTGGYTYKSTASKNPIVPVSGTGVTVSAYSLLKGTEEISNAANGTGASFVINDNNVTFTLKATHTAGNWALTNLNKLPVKDVRIDAGTKEISKTIKSYRKEFAGGTANMGTINSALIRELSGKRAWDTSAFEFQAAVGDTKLIFAFPKSKSAKTPKFEYFTMSWESFSGFKKVADVEVADSRGGENGKVPYTVYEYTPAGAFAAPTKFRVTM